MDHIWRGPRSDLGNCGHYGKEYAKTSQNPFFIERKWTFLLSSRDVKMNSTDVFMTSSSFMLVLFQLRIPRLTTVSLLESGSGFEIVAQLADTGQRPSLRLHTVRWSITLIVWTQKWEFFCKVQRRPPADMFLNGSLPPKTSLRRQCSWPPWPWFSYEKSLKIFKVSYKIRNFDPHFKNLYLARKWV
jgi:hypothetical protein